MKTDELFKQLTKTKEPSDLLNTLPGVSFTTLLNDYIDHSPQSKSQIIEKAQIERTYGYQILNGTRRPSRNKVISLAIALGLDFDQITRLLALCDHGNLYAKVPRDALIIFGIAHHMTLIEINELLADHHFELLTD
jgi:hypothetical protein